MTEYPVEKVRELFKRYCLRKGHGALGKMAERLDVSRQHLTKFQDGGNISDSLCLRMVEELAKDDFVFPDYQGQRELTATQVLAKDLRGLADILDSGLPAELKRQKFTAFIRGYSEGIEEWASLIKEGK